LEEAVDTAAVKRKPGLLHPLVGSRDGAFEKAVAIWASMHGLSAVMLSGQLGGVLNKPAHAARLEQTVVELIERGLGRPRACSTDLAL